MLTLEPPFFEVDGYTIFRDSADPDLLYYLPRSPRLARRGDQPALELLKYRYDLSLAPPDDPTRGPGAGIAMFEAEAGLEEGEHARIESDAGRQAGRSSARLVAAPFLAGTVRALVAGSGEDNALMTALESELPAPLTSPFRTAFVLQLTAEGARLVEEAVNGGTMPVGLVYELEFDALLPALHARVTMDYERIYDRFAASIGFEYQMIRAELDLDLAWLEENGFIDIEITSFVSDEDKRWQEQFLMELLKGRIVRDFFQSAMPDRPTGGSAGGALAGLLGSAMGSEPDSSSAMFVLKLKYERQVERRTFTLTWHGRQASRLTHACVGYLSPMVEEDEQPPVIREIDLGDMRWRSLEVGVYSAIDFEDLPDLQHAVVHLEHPRFSQTYDFSREQVGPHHFAVNLDEGESDEYTWNVRYVFDGADGAGPLEIEAGPYTSNRRQLVIQPLAHFRHRTIRFRTGPLQPDTLLGFRIAVRVPGEEGAEDRVSAELSLDAGAEEVVWRVRQPAAYEELAVLARPDWIDAQGERHAVDEVPVVGDSLLVLGPYEDLLELLVVPPARWDELIQILVQLRYEEGDYFVEEELRFDQQTGAGGQRIQVPLRDRSVRAFRWRQTVFFLDGRIEESDWEEADKAVLVVGPPAPPERAIRVVMVGTLGGRVLGLRVDIYVDTPEGETVSFSELFMQGGDPQREVVLPLQADGTLKYRYEVSHVTMEGPEPIRSGEDTRPMLLVRGGSGQ